MWLTFLRFLYGYVYFTAEGGFPERFLSEATAYGLQITDTVRQGERFFAACPAAQYRLLRPLAKAACMRLKIIKKYGIYFHLFPYRKRIGIPIGLVLSAILLLVLSGRIWVVTVQSDVAVNTKEILSAVADCGVYVGCRIQDVDMQTLRIEALSALENLVYVSVNPNGCVARVTVSTRIPTPTVQDPDDGCSNLVATQDGYILKTEVYSGKAAVAVGDGVTAGTILVSGTVDTNKGNLLLKRSAGRIIAQTTHTVLATVPFSETQALPYGKVLYRPYLRFLCFDIPLFANTPLDGAYTKTTYLRLPSNGEFALPVGIIDTRYTPLQPTIVTHSQEDAGALAAQKLQAEIAALTANGILVQQETARKVTISEQAYTITVTLQCEENIAKEIPLKIIGETVDKNG